MSTQAGERVPAVSRPLVRLATAADADAVADTLARAFMGYAWTDWAIPAEDRFERIRGLHYLFAGLVGSATRTTWVTEDLAAVACWIPPTGFVIPPYLAERLDRESGPLFGDRMEPVDALDALTRMHRPKEPHWWLATVGTRPERRREGLASLVLDPILRRCDQDRRLAAVETSSEATVTFYRRLGFEVGAAYCSPDGALPTWLMVREPAPQNVG